MSKESHIKVPIKNIKREIIAYAIVEPRDAARILSIKWHLNQGYPMTKDKTLIGDRKTIPMSRVVMGLPSNSEMVVDHINFDKLDNRRANLRVVTKLENQKNRPPLLHRHGRPDPNEPRKGLNIGRNLHAKMLDEANRRGMFMWKFVEECFNAYLLSEY